MALVMIGPLIFIVVRELLSIVDDSVIWCADTVASWLIDLVVGAKLAFLRKNETGQHVLVVC